VRTGAGDARGTGGDRRRIADALRLLARARPRHLLWNARFLSERLRGRRVVLFECQQPRDWEFLQSVFEALAGEPRVACFVLTNDRGPEYGRFHRVAACREELAAAGVAGGRIAANLGSLIAFGDAFLAATAWDNALPARRAITRVHVPHGLVNKVDQYGAAMAGFDVLLSSGPLCTELATAALARGGVAYEIAEVGYPKLDVLLRERATAPRAAAAPARVLFAPTWGRHAALDRWGLAPVDALLAGGFRVAVKLHPMSLAGAANARASGGVDWQEELARYAGDAGVEIAGAGPRALAEADVLVSDASGVAFEFMLLGKPVVFLDVPEYFADAGDPLARGRGGDLARWGRRYGVVVSGPEQLAEGVSRALAEAGELAERGRELAALLVVNPGGAGAAAAAWLCRRLGLAGAAHVGPGAGGGRAP